MTNDISIRTVPNDELLHVYIADCFVARLSRDMAFELAIKILKELVKQPVQWITAP